MKLSVAPIRLIVGLGNPGTDYAQTRHNAGQDFVEQLARHYNSTLSANTKFFGLTSHIVSSSHELRLLVPTTYMNKRWRVHGVRTYDSVLFSEGCNSHTPG